MIRIFPKEKRYGPKTFVSVSSASSFVCCRSYWSPTTWREWFERIKKWCRADTVDTTTHNLGDLNSRRAAGWLEGGNGPEIMFVSTRSCYIFDIQGRKRVRNEEKPNKAANNNNMTVNFGFRARLIRFYSLDCNGSRPQSTGNQADTRDYFQSNGFFSMCKAQREVVNKSSTDAILIGIEWNYFQLTNSTSVT